ncbi:MAG: ABC transporter substrate-binding protein [Halobacteriaceae archaeon]
MAGCSSGGGSSNDPTDTSSGGDGGNGSSTTTSGPKIVEDTLKWHLRETSTDIPSANLNWWAANPNGDLSRQVYTHTGTDSETHNYDWIPLSVLGWTEDQENNELRVQVREDVYWTQGGETIDPFTAGDLKTWFELQRRMTPKKNRPENPAVVGWRVEGDNDRTFVMELNPNGYNIEVVTSDLESQYITTYRNGFFGTKLEELRSASTKEEKSAIRKEVANKEITLADDPPICTPWMLETANPQTARFTLNEDHWVAKSDATTPRTLEIKVVGGGSSAGYQALKSGDIHISDTQIPDSIPNNSVPDQVKQVTYATAAGWTLKMNYGGKIDPYMGIDTDKPREEWVAGAQQAKVRQGIGHAIKFSDVLANHLGSRAADLIDPFQKAHPSSVHRVKGRFPDFYENDLPSYTARDLEMAAQRFEEAGLTKEGGTWTKPNGDPLKFVIQASSTDVSMMRTIHNDLKDFGVKTELQTLGSQVWKHYNQGSYGAVMGWNQDKLPVGLEARGHLVPGAVWPAGPVPEKYKVPPIGEMDAEPTETVHPRELTKGFETENPSAHAEATKKLVWTYAYHLTNIPLMPWMGGFMVNDEAMNWAQPAPDGTFAVPNEDHDPLYGGGYYFMQRLGARGQTE